MARVDSYKKGSVNNIIHEHDRTAKTLKNDVVKQRSHLNFGYGLGDKNADSSAHDFVTKMNNRVSEIMQGKKVQDQTHVLGEWIITYPVSECDDAEEDLGETDEKGRPVMHKYHVAKDPKQMKRFFEECWRFTCERYGAENVLGAWVHMDETTPQIHIDFVPETESRKTHRKTVSSASLLSLYEKMNFQKDLEKDMEMTLHKKGMILNGRTQGKGDKTPQELREEQAKKDAEERDAKEKAEQERLQMQAAELARLKQWLNGYEFGNDARHQTITEAWNAYDAMKHPEAHQKASKNAQKGDLHSQEGLQQDRRETPQNSPKRGSTTSSVNRDIEEQNYKYMEELFGHKIKRPWDDEPEL